MTVQELIEELQTMDLESEVLFTYDYGDYVHTQVAKSIHIVEQGLVKRSEYHQMDKVIEEEDLKEDDDNNKVTLLR